ncbi:hypothetical protein M9H77_34238 [Catharanthus roseus]|uniref:Uncharacterized protein n=1 Tax=Catharanthus roseus TaxID=4058 RepID=A0ACB9ZMG4_CATRO|nr:hypothetical protein M9H77_34238 [Catharanthus roseus]
MQGRNTIEEVLCLSAQRGYTVFYRNRKESNVLSDIVVAHPTSIAMIRTWPYVLIMDTTYKTNKLKYFEVQYATIGNCMDDSDRRHIDQNMLVKLTEMVKDEEVVQRVWTSQVLHFGVKTTKCAESEHSSFGFEEDMARDKESTRDGRRPGKCQYLIPIQLEDVYNFWRKLEIGADIPDVHERDMDSEIRDLTLMLEESSMRSNF